MEQAITSTYASNQAIFPAQNLDHILNPIGINVIVCELGCLSCATQAMLMVTWLNTDRSANFKINGFSAVPNIVYER